MTRLTKELIVLAFIGAVLILAYDLSGIGGNIRFYSKWVECGQRPVSGAASKGGPVYYKETPIVSALRGPQTYFCTPLEAERSGHSANPDYYDFPHLREVGERSPL